MSDLNNTQDVVDSREIIERIAELLEDTGKLTPDEDHELWLLQVLAVEGKQDAEEWEDGATLIRESYFQEYVMELAEDIEAIPNFNTWPATCIDWEQAARELQVDYTEIEWNGVTYWVR